MDTLHQAELGYPQVSRARWGHPPNVNRQTPAKTEHSLFRWNVDGSY